MGNTDTKRSRARPRLSDAIASGSDLTNSEAPHARTRSTGALPKGDASSWGRASTVSGGFARFVLLVAMRGVASCGQTGDAVVTVEGSGAVTDGIPPRMASREGFDDGWELRVQRFMVNVGSFAMEDFDGARVDSPGYTVVDLARSRRPVRVAMLRGVEAQRWALVSYEVAPTNARSVPGNVSERDVAWMRARGVSVYLEAEATHPIQGGRTIRWGFSDATRYVACRDARNQSGVVVSAAHATSLRLTLRAEQLFYDDLESSDARLRFAAIAAADQNGDREVTLDELERVPLTALPLTQYGAGSDGSVRTLRDFVSALTITLGHFDGEGTCTPVPFERSH